MVNNELKNEFIEFIKIYNESDYKDIKQYLTDTNEFKKLYDCDVYVYFRVSTVKQDFGRQIIELYEYCKNKNISIPVSNIYLDKYTGKKIDREQYQLLKSKLKKNDYLLIPNLSRLGRNWDEVKKEWYDLEVQKINKIILDNENLSIELPNEKKETVTLNKKFIQDITFSACLYSACQKIQEVSEATKAGLKKAVAQGKKLGRPNKKENVESNFIEVLRLQVEENKSQNQATKKYNVARTTYNRWLVKELNKYSITSLDALLKILEVENEKE